MAEKRNLTTKVTIDNLLSQVKSTFVKKTAFNALDSKVTTLIGADTGKSVRTIANEELAVQLVPENAIESLDTLQEIAAWIQSHPADAAALNAKLTLGTHNVAGYVKATGTYVSGTSYYENSDGTGAVDTSGFEEGVTPVTDYYVSGLVAEQYSNVQQYVEAIESDLDSRLDVLEAVGSTKVEASETNGNIKVDGSELNVYTLPENVVKTTDVAAYDNGHNGSISIQGTYTTVYVLPDDVLHESDILDYTAVQIGQMLADANFTVNTNTVTTAINNTTTFTATAPSTITVTATSGSTDVATVASDGGVADGDNKVFTFTVTGVTNGTATITVVGSDNQYATETVTATITNA